VALSRAERPPRTLFEAQRFDGTEMGGTVRGVDPGEDADDEAHQERDQTGVGVSMGAGTEGASVGSSPAPVAVSPTRRITPMTPPSPVSTRASERNGRRGWR
jgi:hypothetical protein